MIQVVCGVDTSTQSCKVEFFSLEDGRRIAGSSAAHPPVSPPRSEQDPHAWWRAFVEAFRATLAAAGEVSVRAISVAGQCHGMVPLDAQGEVIRDAKLWNDTTTNAELLSLTERIGAEQLLTSTGSLPTAAFTISKVAWLAQHEPENFARLATILLPHDYLTFRLTGAYATDRSEASGTGYFDPAENRYLLEHLALIDGSKDWASMLPQVLPADGVVGSLTSAALAELGLADPVTVTAGGGDQHASALGLGIIEGDAVFAFGTSGVVYSTTPEPVRDLSGFVNGVANLTGGFLPLVCTLNGAKVIDTFARLMGVTHDELSALALGAGDSGPVLAAFLDGERTPNRPLAAGLLADLTTDTTREELARAAYEGVVFGLVAGLEHMDRCGVRTDGEVIAIGGATQSYATTQILADALGKPVHLVDTPQAVARGAAVQAAAVLRGEDVATLAARWRPERQVAAVPRALDSTDRYARYTQVAANDLLDRARS